MNAFSSNTDFLPQFKAIGQSLKRRFFRKPNVSDAVDQYEVLCQELQREEQREFAAICCLEASRSEETLSNPIPQANLLVKAGKLFLQARNSYRYFEQDEQLDNSNFRNERGGHASYSHFQMAIQCLEQAAKIYKSQKHFGMSVIISMQIGEALYKERIYGDALKHFRIALDITKTNFTVADQLPVLDNVLKCKVKLTEYDSVSKIVSDMLITLNEQREDIPHALYTYFVQSFEITRVCLILLLGINTVDIIKFIWPEGLTTASSSETLSDGDEKERKEVLLHLKSLVLAVQNRSVDEIQAVKNSLSHLLNEAQLDLFEALIQMQS